MLAEFLDKVFELTGRAQGIELAQHPDLPDVVFRRVGTNVTEHEVPPPRRHHTLEGVQDIIRAVVRATEEGEPEVYHDDTAVRVLLDREDRRDTLDMPLHVSERFRTLEALAKAPRAMSPAAAVKFLRFELQGTGIDAVVAGLRRIDFTRSGSGASNVQHGRESLGRSVEAAVQQADQVPEEFVVETPLYTNPGLRQVTVRVRVGVYLDPGNESIEVRTLADEVAFARNAAQEALGGALREAFDGDVPVYHGRP